MLGKTEPVAAEKARHRMSAIFFMDVSIMVG